MVSRNPPAVFQVAFPLILLLALSGTTLFLTGRGQPGQAELRAARQAAARGNYVIAARLSASVAQKYPDRPDLWQQAGEYARQANDAAAACSYYQAAIELAPLPDLVLLSGAACLEAGKPDETATAWSKLLHEPSIPDESVEWLVDYHLQLGQLTAALESLQVFIERHPHQGSLYYQQGLILAASDPEAARPVLQQAAELDPSLRESIRMLDNKLALGLMKKDPAYALVQSGRALASLGEWQMAQTAFTRAVELNPYFAEAWAFLGEAKQQGTSSPAENPGLSEIQHALQLDPESVAAYTLLSLFWQRQGDLPQARQAIQAALALEGENPALYPELGNILAKEGDMDGAAKAYARAVELAPKEPLYWRTISAFSVHYNYDVRQVGLEAARQAVLLAPDDPANQVCLAQALLHLKDLNGAERFLLQAIAMDPRYAPAHLQLGLLHLINDDLQQSQAEFEAVTELAPGSPVAEQAIRLLQMYFP